MKTAIFLLLLLSVTSCQKQKTVVHHCSTSTVKDSSNLSQEKPILKFLVTADPQYNLEQLSPPSGLTVASNEVFKIATRKIQKEQFKGLIIAGDLTHNARLGEIEYYLKQTQDIRSDLYEGLGNHDFRSHQAEGYDSLSNTNFGFQRFLEGEIKGWDEGSLRLFEYVRDHHRNTPVNQSLPNIHYSWDWNGIHFVQLHLSPADEPQAHKSIQNPFRAFSFLKQDLAAHIKDETTPIILIHHYGFDDFSRGVVDGEIKTKAQWWSEKERIAYWNLLQEYNILAIFNGHAHNCDFCENCYLPWAKEHVNVKPISKNSIPTFVSGAAREGYYLEVFIYESYLEVFRSYKEEVKYRYAYFFQY